MSVHDPKVIVASYNVKRHFQTYKNHEIWITIDGREDFLKETYNKTCDIFGLLHKGIDFIDDNSIKNIVTLFQQYKNMNWIVSEEKYLSRASLFMRKYSVDPDNTGFSSREIKEEKTMRVEGIFRIYG